MFDILIQYDQTTGRYHPAYYQLSPLPGGDTTIARYKSKGHHTLGFKTLDEAQKNAVELAAILEIPVPSDGFSIREMVEVGTDVLLRVL